MSQKKEGLFYPLEEDTNFDTRFEEHQDFVEAMEQKEFLKIKTIEGNKFSTPFQDIWTNPEQTHQVYFVHDPVVNTNYLRIRGDVENRPKSVRRLRRRLSYFLETELSAEAIEALENGDEAEQIQAISNFAIGFCFYDPRYLGRFEKYFKSSSVEVRLATIRAIGFQLWNECAPMLENAIQNDSNSAVRAYATETLRQIQQPDFDPDDLYEHPENYPNSLERITEKGLIILPQIKNELQAWMKQQGYLAMDALVLYQYLVETYGEFKPTDEPLVAKNETLKLLVESNDNDKKEPSQPEITEQKQRKQQLQEDKQQLKELKEKLKQVEERIKQAQKTNIFGRKQSGENERQRDELMVEIKETFARIAQNKSAIDALEE